MQSKHADKPVHFGGGGGGVTLKECEKLNYLSKVEELDGVRGWKSDSDIHLSTCSASLTLAGPAGLMFSAAVLL